MRQWQRIRGFARLILVMALLVALLPSPLTLAQGTAVFSRVDVAGNQRIEADSIRVFAGIEPGQPVTPEQLNLAVRRLFETGLFEDVTVMPEAGRLVITVVENPTINQIAFEGNDSLDDEELGEVIQLRPRLAYSVPAAEADAQRIIDAYQAGRALRRLGQAGDHPASRRTGSIWSTRSTRAAGPRCSGSTSPATRCSPTAGSGG